MTPFRTDGWHPIHSGGDSLPAPAGRLAGHTVFGVKSRRLDVLSFGRKAEGAYRRSEDMDADELDECVGRSRLYRLASMGEPIDE